MGIVLALGGWAIAVGGLFATQSNLGRGIAACIGIAVILVGVLGLINGYYLKHAIWKQ
jgi:hypothetical protein